MRLDGVARGPLLGAGAVALAAVLVAATTPAPAHPFPDTLADEWTESDACWRQAARAYGARQAPDPAAPATLAEAGTRLDSPARTWLARGAALGGWDAAPPHALTGTTLPEALLDLYEVKGVAVTPRTTAAVGAFAADLDPRIRAHLAPLVARLAHAIGHHHDAYAGAGAPDQAQLVHAADGLLLATSTHAPALRELPDAAWPSEPVRDPVGVVAVGSPGPDDYTVDRFLQVDPAGEDDFHNNAGGGAAFVSLDITDMRMQEVAVHLDLGGDDWYGFRHDRQTDQPQVAQGGAQDGIGIMVDWRGNDTYRADEYAQGGVFRSGVGVAWDRHGDESWRAGGLAQGGSNGGLALFVDELGSDSYELDGGGLGFGRGDAVGLFASAGGDDYYDAGFGVGGMGKSYGHGVFLDDGEGSDRYSFEGPTRAADDSTWTQEKFGVGCDDG